MCDTTQTKVYSGRMRFLVTGSAGFVGSHLCEELLNKNHELICLDNLYTSSRRYLNHILDNPRLEFVTHDVSVSWIQDLRARIGNV
jgi:UDP-glucuronate decarboxylase